MTILSLKNQDTVVLNDTLTTAVTSLNSFFEIEDEVSPPKKKSSIKPNTHADLVGQLSELCHKRKEWEENAYKVSNELLYNILANCLDIYQQMKGRSLEQVIQRKKLTAALAEAGFTCTEATHLSTKIVRYVFRTDRKRSHVYSRVIISADEHKKDAMSLPKWISENGGIEEIRRKSKDGFSPSELKAIYKDAAESKLFSAKELVSSFKTVKELEASDVGNSHFAIALLRKNSDGTSSIVFGTHTPTIINMVLVEAGKQISSKQKMIAKDNVRRSLKEERSNVMKEAI